MDEVSLLPRGAQDLWGNREFVLLAAGQAIARGGDGLYVALLTWAAWKVSHQAGAVALVGSAATAPAVIATVIGASLADRLDPRRLMIAADLGRVLLLVATALLAAGGLLGVWSLAAIAAGTGLASAVFTPARNAIVPAVVPSGQLARANGLLQASFRAAFFTGPLLLAVLSTVLPLPGLFLASAGGFLASVLTLAAMRPARARQACRAGLWADLAAGYRALRKVPDVQILIANFIVAILCAGGFLSVGLTLLAATRLHGGAGAYGTLLGVAGVAEVTGALVLTRVVPRRPAAAAVLAWAVIGLFRGPLGAASSLLLAVPLMAATGLCSAVTDVSLITVVQQRVPRQHLAKILGLWEAGIAAGAALSAPLAAAVISLAGLTAGFALCGTALVTTALTAAWLLHRLAAGRPGAGTHRRRTARALPPARTVRARAPGSSPAQQGVRCAVCA